MELKFFDKPFFNVGHQTLEKSRKMVFVGIGLDILRKDALLKIDVDV